MFYYLYNNNKRFFSKLIYRYKRNITCIHNYVCNKDIERKTAVFYQAHIELLQKPTF